MLYAHDRYAVLLIFQGLDAAGKDGAIRHVMSGVNPLGCQAFSFKRPSEEEMDHDTFGVPASGCRGGGRSAYSIAPIMRRY